MTLNPLINQVNGGQTPHKSVLWNKGQRKLANHNKCRI